jgi:NADH-quinone oxidoreductase subunit N
MLQILILSAIGVLAMISEVLNFKKAMPYIAIVGAGVTIASIILHWGTTNSWFGHMMVDDNFGQAFMLIASIVFLLWLLLFSDMFKKEETISDFISLLSFAMVGGFMMVSFSNLAMLFLGIEILSIPVYVLAGSNRRSLKSNESAFKYFLMGAFASGILLFGIAFLYGATGTFDVTEMAAAYKANSAAMPYFFGLGILLVIFALSFKISAVPFHFWTPDVYEGAPNQVTAFMATLVKAFAAAASFRLFYELFGGVVTTHTAGIAALSALTMIVGNVLGAIQDNPKRILAYSSIGHAGFMLLAILVNGTGGAQALLYYVAAYSVASLLAFFIINKVLVKEDFYWSVGDFNGLVKRNKLMAIGMTVALLSMAGIPPLSGFFAKYFIFSAAFKNGYSWLVIVAIIASLIGVYYYFKFIIGMFMREPDSDSESKIELTSMEQILIVGLIVIVVLLGILPDSVFGLIE